MNKKKVTYGELNDLNLKAIIALSRCMQSVNKRELRIIKEGGLTYSQFGVLEVLYHKGDLRVSEILEKTLSTGGNMTVVIDNLAKDNLIERRPDPNDRRASLISISEKGRKLMSGLFPKHVDNLSEIFSPLNIEEKKSLINTLKKLSGV
ncbi:MarR family winged helix-turn-helix transcriptional regulator [Clostridium beijerinckii]|uniref:MarR family winged helix-turn-helix transcriptional regulator n=1 Tax=Clostridium beijerinckii TaxID=1520 RepID=UPI0022E5CD8A|nr:MarR family transcriptional regulator [Clostridium beijerinckii]